MQAAASRRWTKDMRLRVGRRASVGWVGRLYLTAFLAMLVVAVLLAGGYLQQSRPPAAPVALGAIPAAASASEAFPNTTRDPPATTALKPSSSAAPRSPQALAPSVPLSVKAAAVGIDSRLLQVGVNNDGTVEVPATYQTAAWYRLGPTPGALGPAVIVGHVDSFEGPGVFFKLGAMRPGQTIDVARADKTVAHFRVDAVDSYPKDQFPTKAVYGPVDYAGLRLITCGGTFDANTKSYEANIVVYASLVRP